MKFQAFNNNIRNKNTEVLSKNIEKLKDKQYLFLKTLKKLRKPNIKKKLENIRKLVIFK